MNTQTVICRFHRTRVQYHKQDSDIGTVETEHFHSQQGSQFKYKNAVMFKIKL